MSAPTVREIEAGRQLFKQPWDFTTAAGSIESLPRAAGLEIAFAGRSNVGKSSLINALTGRKSLARTSHTPGRTQELVFFSAGGPLSLVDMPGYGFASAPKTKVAAWTDLIHSYLRGRANLARVYVLIDSRHGLKPLDEDVLRGLDSAAVNYQIVLTKTDEVKKADLDERLAVMRAALSLHPAAHPDILMTSSRSGAGIPEFRAAISRLLADRR